MEMIDVLKNQLQDGMEVSKIKILQNKTKFIFKYDGLEKQGEVQNTCAIGYEQRLCRKAIDTLMSGIYIDKNQLDLARKWLNGEMWENTNNKMKRSVYLSEMIEEMQKALIEQGDREIESIGTSSGINSSFLFRAKGTPLGESDIVIKINRD